MAFVKLDLCPHPRTLRQFGLIGLVAFAALAALARWRVGLFRPLSPESARWTMYVLAVLAAYSGLFAAVLPRGLRPLYVLLTIVTYPIGIVAFHVVMAIVFYLVIAPVGLLFKIIGRDALHRRFEPAAPTYWIRRRQPADAKRYFRQF
jgi:hypothetical protein